MNKITLTWLVVLFLTFNLALAIGIRPAKTEMISDNLKHLEGQFWVVNNDQREFSTKIYLEGEMSQYVTITTNQLTFRQDTDALPITFTVNLPETVPPGTSTAVIVIEEELPSAADTISSKIVLKHKINIQGPYPDKYIITKLNFHDQGDKIEFVSEIENLGKLNLEKVQTKFYVNDKQQQTHTLETEVTPLQTKENKLLRAALEKDLFELGQFEVSAVTIYDDQQVELTKSLLVGKPEVDITYFDQYFKAFKINEYSMDLLNKWNKEVENVYVDVQVKRDEQKIDEFRTKSVDIAGLTTERINDYFDARDKSPGKLTFEMIVNFWNTYKMEQKTFQGELLPEEEFNQLPLTGRAAESTFSTTVGKTITWLLIPIILISFILFLYFKYIKPRKDR